MAMMKDFSRATTLANMPGHEILPVCDDIPGVPGNFDILALLRKKILPDSSRRGYLDHPWKIDAGQMAEKMGMRKTTLLEHIPKAERRLIGISLHRSHEWSVSIIPSSLGDKGIIVIFI